MEMESTINKILDNVYSENSCFFCGRELTPNNNSEEHVIPKWIQKKFNLWNEKMVLLNGTSIPYKSLKVPCCKECNGEFLSSVEKQVAAAIRSGVDAVRNLNKEVLFIWLGKMFLGLHYKELSLPIDRTNPQSEMISSPEILERMKLHRLFLQSVRGEVVCNDFVPYSILVFECKAPDNPRGGWDFVDNWFGPFISVRIGNIGIISVLQDCQTLEQAWNENMSMYYDKILHPIQFGELESRAFYQATRFNRTPKYIIRTEENGQNCEVHCPPLMGMSCKSVYNEWNIEEYCNILAWRLGLPLKQLYYPEVNQAWTFLHDAENDFCDIECTDDFKIIDRNKEPTNWLEK